MTQPPKRYSPLDRDSVHADMRVAPERTFRSIASQPGVLAAHQGCGVCAELRPRAGYVFVNQARVMVSMVEIADALGLPPGCRPVRMFVSDDPQLLHVVIESDDFEPVSLLEPTPVIPLNADMDG